MKPNLAKMLILQSVLMTPNSKTFNRLKPIEKQCIMCGKPRTSGLFCGNGCKEKYREEPEYWDKQCKYKGR